MLFKVDFAVFSGLLILTYGPLFPLVVGYEVVCFVFIELLIVGILFFPAIIFISWRLITLQYCSGFCHTFDMNQPWIYMCSPS